MKKLPQYLAECPQHRWNSKTQLFDAHLFQRQEDGSIVFTQSYAITPHVFAAIMADMKTAYAAFEATTKGAQVIPMKKAGG
jgi:hypothetical protein